VQGFPPRTPVRFTLGAASLGGTVTTDSRGAATLSTRLPALDAREYVVVAYGGQRTAVATLLVDGVAPGTTPTPTFCPATTPPVTESATPTPTPTPTSSSPRPTSSSPRPTSSSPRPTETDKGKPTKSPTRSATDDDDDDDDRGGPGNLPSTGAAVVGLLVLAGVAVAFGTGLITIGRRRPTGRHVR
jgi:LPXTG-motif cell wall-anchored protein